MDSGLLLNLEKSEYTLYISCGLLAGLIDTIFVGDPQHSMLEGVVDKGADQFVVKAAGFFYDHDNRKTNKPKKKPTELHKCISYLEQAFPVNYDARYAKDLNVADGLLEGMTSKNHHLKSLAHSTDIIGLVFSIIDQFNTNGTASFVDKGKYIHATPIKESGVKVPYLIGSDATSKLYCGFVNWLGHLISDAVGSSSTRTPNKEGRGAGLPMPFYELFLFLDLGNFNGETFADTMIKVYEDGYDFRFGITTAIPVVVNELLIRCVWTIRQRILYQKSWGDCLPRSSDKDFRLMLLVGSFSFSVVDGVDAASHAVEYDKGIKWNWVGYFSRVNYIGISRLSELLVKECIIRISETFSSDSEKYLERLSGIVSDDNKTRILSLSETVHSYIDCLDYKNMIKDSFDELKVAKAYRIKVEGESKEAINHIMNIRETMYHQMETCFEDCLITFDKGINLMDQGIMCNDSDIFIEGNTVIQKQFGREAQFGSQVEFDEMMESDDDFEF